MGWTVVLAVHIVGAVAWWWLMPGGFPLDHPRFWVNRVLPPMVIVLALVARIRLGNARWLASLRDAIPAAFATLWITAALSAVIVFPDSFYWRYVLPLLLGAFCLIVWMRLSRHQDRAWPQVRWILLPIAFLIGASLPVSLRARPSGTHPTGSPRSIPSPPTARGRGNITLPNGATIDSAGASIRFTRGNVVLSIEPLMKIESRSPDGCWTLLAPRYSLQKTHLALRGIRTSADKTQELIYVADGNASMIVRPGTDPGETLINVTNQIPRIYSHLNTYTELSVAGHRKMFLRFSPCADAVIEVTPQDYPFGRPARFAFLDSHGRFRVVQATNAEKGPFSDLASGPLARGAPLWIELLDDQTPLYRVEFADWSQQCSTQLSPTAGWGVPENSIEFSRAGDDPASAVSIFVTLAATSVGRGYDTVELRDGNYRNQLRVKQYETPSSQPVTSTTTHIE